MSDMRVAFYKHVEKIPDGCWVWTGARTAADYGRVRSHMDRRYAHRVSYELHHGPIPAGLEVLHSCDHPWCVNPEHLSVGTHADNMRDMAERGRATNGGVTKGERHGAARLAESQVREIRRRAAAGENQHQIAAEFGVANTTVSMIHRRATWSHV